MASSFLYLSGKVRENVDKTHPRDERTYHRKMCSYWVTEKDGTYKDRERSS